MLYTFLLWHFHDLFDLSNISVTLCTFWLLILSLLLLWSLHLHVSVFKHFYPFSIALHHFQHSNISNTSSLMSLCLCPFHPCHIPFYFFYLSQCFELLDSMMSWHLFHVLHSTFSKPLSLWHSATIPYSIFCIQSPLSLAHFHVPYSVSLSLAHFCVPYSVPSVTCSFPYSMFHVPTTCLLVSFLSVLLHHLFMTPCLPFPAWTTYHFISCDSVSHFSTFSILPYFLYYSKPCRIKVSLTHS